MLATLGSLRKGNTETLADCVSGSMCTATMPTTAYLLLISENNAFNPRYESRRQCGAYREAMATGTIIICLLSGDRKMTGSPRAEQAAIIMPSRRNFVPRIPLHTHGHVQLGRRSCGAKLRRLERVPRHEARESHLNPQIIRTQTAIIIQH